MAISSKIRDILVKSGWYSGRYVDISQYKDVLDREEYKLFDKAEEFLHEYAGIKIKYENPQDNKRQLTLTIDPILAMESIFRSVSASYEKHCGELFVIIGEIKELEMTIYISSSGAFYGGYDDCLIKLGSDFFLSLENLISGFDFEVEIIKNQ